VDRVEIRYDKRSAAGAALLGLTLLGAVLVAIHPGPFQVDSAVLHGLIGTRSPALTGIVDDVSRLLSPVAMAGWTALATDRCAARYPSPGLSPSPPAWTP